MSCKSWPTWPIEAPHAPLSDILKAPVTGAFFLGPRLMATAVEICLSGGPGLLQANCVAAREGGATRVELCSAMRHQGLSPSLRQISEASEHLAGRVELVTMLRPHPGPFHLSTPEVRRLCRFMRQAATLGATGVALGVLKEGRLDRDAMRNLAENAHGLGLRITCHRAFDALDTPREGLDLLLELGFHRLLSSGLPWGARGNAVDGLPRLLEMAAHLEGRVELVVAGGVSARLAPHLCQTLRQGTQAFSLHAWSSVRAARRVQASRVRELVHAANASRA